MERVLGFFVGLVLICDLAVVTLHVLNDNTSLISDKAPTTSGVNVVPAPGQAFVTGLATHVSVDNAQGEPIPTPFTIEAVERGVGKVTIEQALIGSQRATIVWDGGTPLPVEGDGGALDFGATHIEIDEQGSVVSVDGNVKKLKPGTYSLGTAVAVGTGGLSAPREGVTFSADEQTTLSARNGVVIRRDPGGLKFHGPGNVLIEGNNLTVQYADKKSTASKVSFSEGPFELTTEPASGGVHIDAILQGQVDVS